MNLAAYKTDSSDRWTPRSSAPEVDDLSAPTPFTSWYARVLASPQHTPSGAETPNERDIPAFATRLVVFLPDPPKQLAAEISERFNKSRALEQAYRERVNALESAAAYDGFSVNNASKSDFWTFLKSQPLLKKGSLVFVDNGNLRVSWRNDYGDHIAIQFLGGHEAQFVIFTRPKRGMRSARAYGRCSVDEIRHQITTQSTRDIFYG